MLQLKTHLIFHFREHLKQPKKFVVYFSVQLRVHLRIC